MSGVKMFNGLNDRSPAIFTMEFDDTLSNKPVSIDVVKAEDYDKVKEKLAKAMALLEELEEYTSFIDDRLDFYEYKIKKEFCAFAEEIGTFIKGEKDAERDSSI